MVDSLVDAEKIENQSVESQKPGFVNFRALFFRGVDNSSQPPKLFVLPKTGPKIRHLISSQIALRKNQGGAPKFPKRLNTSNISTGCLLFLFTLSVFDLAMRD